MVKQIFTVLLLGLFCLTLTASAEEGQSYLIRIAKDGRQEATPLKKGEKAEEAIQRVENSKVVTMRPSSPTNKIDTIKYLADSKLGASFIFYHKDVMFQWYKPAADGFVRAFYWRNNDKQADNGKATVRAWFANPRLEALSATKWMGYYKDLTDGDGKIQPFKPVSPGDTVFYIGLKGADSAKYGFDPTGKEAAWSPGGQQFTLKAKAWQGVTLADWGDPMPFVSGQLFGFSLSNDDPPATPTDAGITLLAGSPLGAPFHSLKYYEKGRLSTTDGGWWVRTDYEWGMYVIVEYTKDRGPVIKDVTILGTTLQTTPREVTATITDDNPEGGLFGVKSAFLYYTISPATTYDSVAMTATGDVYKANIPGASAGAAISYYIKATDVLGLSSKYTTLSYKIFAKTTEYLLVYNNAQYSLGNADYLYTSSSPAPMKFDRWSAPSDGVTELGTLLSLYQNVLVVDGSYPSRDVYPALKTWLGKATTAKKANLFFTSQDYGCFVQSACADTTFAAGTLENDYFGVTKIGPQDIPPSKSEYRMVPQTDPVTNYLKKWETDSASTLWYDPTFELGFAGYQDAMTPKAGAVALFKNAAGTNVHGVKNAGSTFNVVYLGFDAAALQFRSDTALAATADKKYWWIVDVGSLSTAFFKTVTSVKSISDVIPIDFKLGQNYPNPFNPSTVIEYSVRSQSNVEVAIYNMLGQKVMTLVNEVHNAGQYQATWSGNDNFGNKVASGVYFYQMRAGSFESVKKMMLMK